MTCHPCTPEIREFDSADLLWTMPKSTTKAKHIIDVITEEFGLSWLELRTKNRKRINVEARQIAMFMLRKHTHMSFKAIGETFGGRDHTTSIHSINTVRDLAKFDAEYRARLAKIDQAIYN